MLTRLNDILNPFDVVQYEGKFPHSRSLRTSFYKKIIDTFKVLNGATRLFKEKQSTEEKWHLYLPFKIKTRPGLFDYATLGTFRMIHALATLFTNMLEKDTHKNKYFIPYSKPKKVGIYIAKALVFIPWIVFRGVNVLTNGLLRYGISAILTAAFVPIFILPAHGISKLVAWVKRNQIETNIPIINKNGVVKNTYVKLSDRLKEIKVEGKTLSLDKNTGIRCGR